MPGWSRIAGAALGVFIVLAAAGPSSAHSVRSDGHWRNPETGCTRWDTARSLAAEQHRVLDLVGSGRVLRNQQDLDRLAQPNPTTGMIYSLLPHMFDSMQGMGFTIVNVAMVGGPGKPALLLYRPNPRAKNVLDPNGADFPYVLAGWGYVAPYTPGVPPSVPSDPGWKCLTTSQWLVHERSVHPSDTWQNIAVPPVEAYRGQVADDVPPTAQECQCPVGLNHGRFWDIHFWLNDSPVPTVSMFNPGKLLPGFPTGNGFFYPQTPK